MFCFVAPWEITRFISQMCMKLDYFPWGILKQYFTSCLALLATLFLCSKTKLINVHKCISIKMRHAYMCDLWTAAFTIANGERASFHKTSSLQIADEELMQFSTLLIWGCRDHFPLKTSCSVSHGLRWQWAKLYQSGISWSISIWQPYPESWLSISGPVCFCVRVRIGTVWVGMLWKCAFIEYWLVTCRNVNSQSAPLRPLNTPGTPWLSSTPKHKHAGVLKLLASTAYSDVLSYWQGPLWVWF